MMAKPTTSQTAAPDEETGLPRRGCSLGCDAERERGRALDERSSSESKGDDCSVLGVGTAAVGVIALGVRSD